MVQAEAGGSGIVARRLTGQAGSDHFAMKIPNNKVIRICLLALLFGLLVVPDDAPQTQVGLVIGKGGETIKNMQARTGARIQVCHL